MPKRDLPPFDDIYQAMFDADIAALERFAATDLDFPTGKDGWVGRH